MKVTFYINYSWDLRNTVGRLTKLDPAGLDYRIAKKGLDREVVEKVLKADSIEEKEKIFDPYLKKYYNQNLKAMEAVKDQYQKIWDQKTDKFFKQVTESMGNYPWKFPEYYFRVQAFYSHASWGQINHLAVWWKHDPKIQYYLNGYELILNHNFEIIDQIYKKRPLPNWYLWALSEIIAYFLVYRNNQIVKELWPGVKEPKHFSYPQLQKPIKDLYPIFCQAKNYLDYLEKSLDYIKKYSEKELTSSH